MEIAHFMYVPLAAGCDGVSPSAQVGVLGGAPHGTAQTLNHNDGRCLIAEQEGSQLLSHSVQVPEVYFHWTDIFSLYR